jgi:hypothetical protein
MATPTSRSIDKISFFSPPPGPRVGEQPAEGYTSSCRDFTAGSRKINKAIYVTQITLRRMINPERRQYFNFNGASRSTFCLRLPMSQQALKSVST